MHLRPLADDFTIALDSSTLLVLANRSADDDPQIARASFFLSL
jgi:hypothetical protein